MTKQDKTDKIRPIQISFFHKEDARGQYVEFMADGTRKLFHVRIRESFEAEYVENCEVVNRLQVTPISRALIQAVTNVTPQIVRMLTKVKFKSKGYNLLWWEIKNYLEEVQNG